MGSRGSQAAEQPVDSGLHVAEGCLQRADVLLAVREAHVAELGQLGRVLLLGVRNGGRGAAEAAKATQAAESRASKGCERVRCR